MIQTPNRSTAILTATMLIAGGIPTIATAEITMPSVLADHMVLQQGEPVTIWGWADAGEHVRVEFGDQQDMDTADSDGRWSVELKPMPASSDPRSLIIHSHTTDSVITIEDVLVGEVWICSGQSNMVWTINGSSNPDEFKATADDPRIRMFTIPNTNRHTPQENCAGQWIAATPDTIGNFSAVAYHFGRNINDHLDVPIGLVNTSWGGSTVEAWIDRGVLEAESAAAPFLEAYDEIHRATSVAVTEFIGDDVDLSDWTTVGLPALVEDLGHNVDGFMWFRRDVQIPTSWVGRPLTLTLGAIDDRDVTYVNGTRVGGMNNWQAPRSYTIAADVVTGPIITIAIRVEDTGGAGGFSGEAKDMTLGPADAIPVSLAGDWHFRLLSNVPSMPNQHRPANLFNGMVFPIRHLTVRGAIWYQGESNAIAPRGEEYFSLFPAMIHNWRDAFDHHDMPFYYVQLPNFTNNEENTVWRYPIVRQAQLQTLRVPHTGMAITLDLGESNDIHPRNKHDVGKRLARLAIVDLYDGDADLPRCGPLIDRCVERDREIVVTFDLQSATARLALRDGQENLVGFEVAGPDDVFHPAEARIDGRDRVIVRSPVAEPMTVRYAWKNNAVGALVNDEGWPASPFVEGVAIR